MNKLIPGLLLIGLMHATAFAQSVLTLNNENIYASVIVKTDKVAALCAVQTETEEADNVRTKIFSRSFPADRTDRVFLNNKFGSMIIRTWDKREVKIDVTIKAYSNNEKQAQELIDRVNIDATKTGEVISCKTDIVHQNISVRGRRSEVKVDYVVYMPASNPLNLSQQFGNVSIGDFSGPLNAKVQYGDFMAAQLLSDNNFISVQYGKTTINELKRATLKQQYGSGLTIGEAGSLDLNAQYAGVNVNTIRGDAVIQQQYGSGLKIGTVNNLDLDAQYASVSVSTIKGNATVRQQYNSLAIGSVGRITLRSAYAGVTIGTLRNDGAFKMSYNNLSINDITPGCRNLTIDAEYGNLGLSFPENYHADFSVYKNYGSFNYGSRVKAFVDGEQEGKHSTTKTYTGKIGNGGNSRIQIKAAYGSVVFK